ncbi:MAG: class I SAM-dependent methyltransferase [Polyangiales bacterium]
MEPQSHWESVYARKPADGVSWYRPHLDRSLAIIEAAALPKDARIVDVGGGASTLVDDLLDRGFTRLTVMDLSARALDVARHRLGDRASRVTWIVGDATHRALPEGSVDLWHDRAVFHFLRDDDARRRYVDQAHRALRPGGTIVVATFGPDGPSQCSGLEVVRYDAEGIHAAFGDAFERLSSDQETHVTPWGSAQPFVYCSCRRA